jgi:thiol-disulfide isomerase/thioredoxin
MALLCLNFKIKAQDNKAIDVTAKGIQIGQKVPDVAITGLHNYKDANGKPVTTAKISDFKGKLLILDFWATWCSPCIAMIPKMDNLQKEFGDKIQFLSVTYQTEKEVLPFLEKFEIQQKKHYDLSVVTNSKELHKLFPHSALPHYVWIDANGVVKAITNNANVNSKNIASLLAGSDIKLKEKVDISVKFNTSKPLFFSNNDFNDFLLKQSTITNYKDGLGRGYYQNIFSKEDIELKWFTMWNRTIPELYQALYKKEIKETIIEVADSTKLVFKTKIDNDYREWLENGNAFCYEIVIKKGNESKAFDYIKNDLENYFSNYTVQIEKRKVKCLTLVRTSNVDKILTKGGAPAIKLDRFGAKVTSCYLRVFISRMQYFLQAHPLPLADETGYANMADLDIQANLSNINAINDALKKYDLQFVEKETVIDMLIIKDKKLNKLLHN